MIQIITTLDEIFGHILNVSWLNHFNSIWKVSLMWSHKKHLDEVFHLNKHNYVEKKIYWKNYFNLKYNKNNVRGSISTFILHVYQNARWNQRKFDPKIIQILLKNKCIFLPKMDPS
jgi:hypothetical protein